MLKTLIYLPDIMVYISIFGFGFLVGFLLTIMIVVYFVMSGHTIVIKKEDRKSPNESLDEFY